MRDAVGKPLWSSGTHNRGCIVAKLTDTAQLVVLDDDGKTWAEFGPKVTISPVVRLFRNDWDQQWDEKSNNVRLLGGSHNSQQTTWRAEFVEPNYDYALIPGFPGILEDGCYSSTKDTQLAKDAMHSCDKSMSLLIGSQTSVGTLRAIAKLVEENGPEQMPGYCCMDNAANSQHFGYDVSSECGNSNHFFSIPYF